jgi:hypothetical protein
MSVCMCQNHLLTSAARSACFYVVCSVHYYLELCLRRLLFDTVRDTAHNCCYNCNHIDIETLLQLLSYSTVVCYSIWVKYDVCSC